MTNKLIKGFSKWTREDKIKHLALDDKAKKILDKAICKSNKTKAIVNGLSENTISHFPFPFGIAPNALINDKIHNLPLVTEESSVVAAIAKAFKFWSIHDGFKTEIVGTEKKGQVHFFWSGSSQLLIKTFPIIKTKIQIELSDIQARMKARNGGVKKIVLIDKTVLIPYYYQIDISFDTVNAMGANFINSCLESVAKTLTDFALTNAKMQKYNLEVNMAILSNYTPNSLVKAKVQCKISDLNTYGESLGINNYAIKFCHAVQIAQVDINRAVTHNKGILNGIDSLALATGNDWRAIEAGAHAYASKSGMYKSLSTAELNNDNFIFKLSIPLAIGTVGGVTNLHPIAKIALQILKKPNAKELMQIMAVAGLAANFSAIDALISTGIQKGHMKMHLNNILMQLNASPEQIKEAKKYFENNEVSFLQVSNWLKKQN